MTLPYAFPNILIKLLYSFLSSFPCKYTLCKILFSHPIPLLFVDNYWLASWSLFTFWKLSNIQIKQEDFHFFLFFNASEQFFTHISNFSPLLSRSSHTYTTQLYIPTISKIKSSNYYLQLLLTSLYLSLGPHSGERNSTEPEFKNLSNISKIN